MSELSDYYRFRNQMEAALTFVNWGGRVYTRSQWDNVLKPVYREARNGEADIKKFAAWIEKQWNRETIQYQIVKNPPNLVKYWNTATGYNVTLLERPKPAPESYTVEEIAALLEKHAPEDNNP